MYDDITKICDDLIHAGAELDEILVETVVKGRSDWGNSLIVASSQINEARSVLAEVARAIKKETGR
jgi:hypothetical protein